MRHKRRIELEEVANGWLLTEHDEPHYEGQVLPPWPPKASDIFTDPAELMARLQKLVGVEPETPSCSALGCEANPTHMDFGVWCCDDHAPMKRQSPSWSDV